MSKILEQPANYSLQEIFEELKFGRTVASQEFLNRCIYMLNCEKCDGFGYIDTDDGFEVCSCISQTYPD